MGKHTLFYSSRCRFCQAFMEELVLTPYSSEIQLVCVDPSPSRPPLPKWLKSVPSLVVQGESSPRVGPGAVNNWLFERKLGSGGTTKSPQQALEERSAPLSLPTYSPDIAPRPDATSRTNSVQRMDSQQPSSAPNAMQNKSAMNEDPMAYHVNEMGSGKWSDNYSFLGGDEFKSDTGYNPIGRSFESLIPVNAIPGSGRATAAPAPKRSMKEEALLNEFQAYSAARDKDIPGPMSRQ